MTRYAKIDDGDVVDIIVCDHELAWVQARLPGEWVAVADGAKCGPGMRYVSGQAEKFFWRWAPPESDLDAGYRRNVKIWVDDEDGRGGELFEVTRAVLAERPSRVNSRSIARAERTR